MPSSRPSWRAPVTAGWPTSPARSPTGSTPAQLFGARQKAETDRRVTIRPAPDTMSNVTGLLPVAQGVAVYAALRQHAKTLRAQGDSRTISQIMADTFYTRLTGQENGVGGVEIQLVMNERTLLRGDHEPAYAPGYGTIPASLARRIVREADRTWIRRLYTAPDSGELVAMDSRRRTFRGKLRDLTVLRDQTCRTPWCDAPIAHVDHARSARRGGDDDRGQRPGSVRSLQLHQGSIRVARRPRRGQPVIWSRSPHPPATATDPARHGNPVTHRRSRSNSDSDGCSTTWPDRQTPRQPPGSYPRRCDART